MSADEFHFHRSAARDDFSSYRSFPRHVRVFLNPIAGLSSLSFLTECSIYVSIFPRASIAWKIGRRVARLSRTETNRMAGVNDVPTASILLTFQQFDDSLSAREALFFFSFRRLYQSNDDLVHRASALRFFRNGYVAHFRVRTRFRY